MPFPEASFDVVISNGVFNLVPDKMRSLKEVVRVLKPNGRFMLADQVLATEPPADTRSMVENWAGWQGGAIPGKEFLAMLREAGFTDADLVAETGFNSSPATRGVLFRATKPAISDVGRLRMPAQDLLGKYQEFFNAAYAEGALDRKTKHLIALGASLAAGCDPWTRFCLAVARELGATENELKETMAIAMTVGATKIQILQESALASMPEKNAVDLQQQDEGAAPAPQESCFTWTMK
jgi:AhpD family alkylhydroperoxidase